MPILTFSCPKCKGPISFDYADYEIEDALKKSPYHFEQLECKCGKKLKTVPWVAVFDEESEEVVTIV